MQIEALKSAEDTGETVIRFNELSGLPAHGVHLTMAMPILAAREVNGQEQPLGPATVQNGQLVFDMDPYRPRAFALTLAKRAAPLPAPRSRPLALPFNAASSNFDGQGDGMPSPQLPATLVSDGITFQMGPTAGGSNNAVICRGQALSLPPGAHRRVYLLAAAVGGDTPATFLIGGHPAVRTIQRWDGYIGQWDNRVWQGQVPELTYDWHNKLAGITPGFIKPATVAWYADHKRLADGRERYLSLLLPVPLRLRRAGRGEDADPAEERPHPGDGGLGGAGPRTPTPSRPSRSTTGLTTRDRN